MCDYNKTIDLEKGLEKILNRIDIVANKLQSEKLKQENQSKDKEEKSETERPTI